MDNTARAARATVLLATANERYLAAKAAAEEAAAMCNRVALADMLCEFDLPRTAVVQMIDWADEPNDDGTYDADLGEAFEADDEEESYGDLGGHGALPVGRHDGEGTSLGTDWDMFLVEGETEPGDYARISVAKVYDWLDALPVQAS